MYLDGAHDFFCDGLACALLKMMVKVGGVIVFDDIHWSISCSPTVNQNLHPETRADYTDEQIFSKQVMMVVNLFMDNDRRWKRLDGFSNNRAVYIRNE